MRLAVRCFLFSTFLLLPFALSCRSATSLISATAWTTHNDPAGFSVDIPAGWVVAADSTQGRIKLRGTRGEQVVIWPIFIEQKQLNATGAARLVMQLARRLDNSLSWTPANAPGNAARVVAKGASRSGATVMTWSNTSTGAAVNLYELEAPPDVYGSSTNIFSRILQSFRGSPDNAPRQAGGGSSAGPLSYVNWSDPQEGAFTIQVPKGWQVAGGAFHLTATDVRSAVTMISPDGQMRIFFGDANIGAYIGPTQALYYAGLREGSPYGLGDGSRLEVRRLMSGSQFASAYAQTRLAAQCSSVQVESNSVRQDLTAAFSQSARAEGMNNAQLTAGDAVFSCTGKNGSLHGQVIAATVLPLPGRSTIWYVYRLYGYIAVPQSQQAAEGIAQQVMQFFRIDQQWRQRSNQIANNAVAADNARSQQIQARARAAIQENQRQTSEMIVKGYEQRSQVYDEISRRRENAILGTTDVVDPSSGKQYKIDSYSSYHWMNNQGAIVGNDTGANPGYGWHDLVTLP
ncbi:MAG: hypothetical protein ABSC77_14685 [Terracidiphilus sp.]|jgi:hypothetical protein